MLWVAGLGAESSAAAAGEAIMASVAEASAIKVFFIASVPFLLTHGLICA